MARSFAILASILMTVTAFASTGEATDGEALPATDFPAGSAQPDEDANLTPMPGAEPQEPPMGAGGVNWSFDPPPPTLGVAGTPMRGQTDAAYFYDTPYGNYTFPKRAPYRLRLDGSRTGVVSAAWFRPVLGVKIEEGSPKVLVFDDTTFASSYRVTFNGLAIAEVTTTVEFRPHGPPKLSANLTLLDDRVSPRLAWVVLTKDTTVRLNDTRTTRYLEFGNATELASLADADRRIEIGPMSMANGTEPSLWLAWSDAPEGTRAYAGKIETWNGTLAGALLVFPDGVREVDPTLFGTSSSPTATGYSSQRKILWNGDRYWVFYATNTPGAEVAYRTTTEGLTWSDVRTVNTGTVDGFDVDFRGPTAALAWYSSDAKFRSGTFYSDTIAWSPTRAVGAMPSSPPLSVAIAADGSYWVAGSRIYRSTDQGATWVDKSFGSWTSSATATSAAFVLPLSGTRGSTSLTGWVYAVLDRPMSQDQLLVGLYNVTSGGWTEHTYTVHHPNVPRTDRTAAMILGDVVTLVYSAAIDENSYGEFYSSQIAFTGSAFDFTKYVELPVSGTELAPFYPAVAFGPPANVYAFWRSKVSNEWVVRTAMLDGVLWRPATTAFPATAGQNPRWLTVPKYLYNRAVFAWRDGTNGSLLFGSVPLVDDFGASAAHPWARAGLSAGTPLIGDMSDAVNPTSGQLVIRQVDAQASGRRLDLTLARVHATPHAFLSGAPLFQATNPTVPMGVGWEIGLPWISSPYVYLGDGQKYVIVWSGSKFENRAGTPFTLYNHVGLTCAGGYDLYLADGTRLNFTADSGCTWFKLNYILDVTGQNRISFAYAADKLVTATDTMGRSATFAYYASGAYAGKLQSLAYAGRSVSIEYMTAANGGIVLWRVTYPLGLLTTYEYDLASDYLIKAVHQVWGATTSYTYTSARVGTEAIGYFVTRQDIKDGATIVRSRTFDYTLVNGWAVWTNIAVGDGSVTKGYQILGFASATRGMTTLVKDAAGTQLSKAVAWYGPTGMLGATDVYLGTATNRNYTNLVAADDWGNPYYTRAALSANVAHETFASYGNANNQNAFRAPALVQLWTDGKIQQENFERLDLVPWTLTTTGGTIGLDSSVWDRAPPSMRMSRTTAGTLSASRTFPTQSGAFLFTTSVRLGETSRDHRILLELGSTTRTELLFAGDGNLKWRTYGGSYVSLQTYAAGTWYRVGLEVDMASGATVLINENRYGPYTIYSAGSVDRVRYDLPLNTATMFVGGYALAKKGVGGSDPYLSFRVAGLAAGRKVEFLDPTDAVIWSGTADGSGNVDVTMRHELVPAGTLRVYDAGGKEEYRSPTREFWPGSTYGYTWPYVYTAAKFYPANSLPADVHSALLGMLQWQTGRGTQAVQESYTGYLTNGLPAVSKVYHDGVPLETAYLRDTYGQVVQTTDVQGKVVYYDYGPAYEGAWPTRERRSLSGGDLRTRATYDFASGLRASTTNARGFATRMAYDALGRLTEIRYFDAEPSAAVLFFDMETPTVGPTATMEDLSGKGNHGTIVGMTTNVPGKVDRARYFSGAPYIDRTSTSSLNPTRITVAAWVNLASSAGTYNPIVAKGQSGADFQYYMDVRYVSGVWRLNVQLKTTTGSGVGRNSAGAIPAGQWTHVAFTFDGSYLRMYINGALDGSASLSGSLRSTTYPLRVGAYAGSTSYLKGSVDEVRIFNVALAATDIAALSTLTYRQLSRATIAYDDASRRVTYVDEDQRRTRETFDTLGRRTKVERLDASGAAYSEETFAYNWQDLVVTYTSPTLNVTQRTYDFLGRLTRETDPAGKANTVSYSDIAQYMRMTDPSGHARGEYRDFAGRLVKVMEIGPPAATTDYTYDEVGNLISVRNALGQVTSHVYNDLNLLTRTIYADNGMEDFTYYDAGALHTKEARDGTVTTYAYDDVYRLTSIDLPGSGDDVTYAYDANGNLLWANNSVAQVSYGYDARDGPLSERTKFLGTGAPDVTASFTYSAAGDLTSLAYPGTAFTLTYEYDAYHRVTRAYNGGTNYGAFTYLKDDAIQDLTFANGLKTSYVYDKVSRPTSIVTKDGSTEKWSFRYAYDNEGNVLGLSGTGIPTQTFAYDAFDRLTTSAGTAWSDLAYVYDALGNRRQIDVSVGVRPNGAGSPTQWQRSGCTANYLCVDDWPTHDGDASYVYAWNNGDADQYAVEDVSGTGTIASVTVTAVAEDIPGDPCTPPGSCPFYLQLTVNGYGSGNKLLTPYQYKTYSSTWTTNPTTGQAWTVAQVNALQVGVKKVDYNEYMDSETRVTQLYVTVSFAASTTYAYADSANGMNELLSIAGAETASFTYDANKSLATRTQAGITWTYAYNGMGLLREVKQGTTTVALYHYDALGRRVKTVEGSTTTYVVYGLGIDPIWEKAGTTETRHVYANGMRIARAVVGGSTYYYHVDALGSTWRMTDSAKAVVFSTSYEPFGRSWGTTGSLASTERYRFAGERNDTESGLTYLRARQYDPKLGRFTSMDPVLGAPGAPQTLNRYPYVVNNPTRYTDPSGEFPLLLLAAMLLIGIGSTAATVSYAVPATRPFFDAAMTALGFVPFFGDILSSSYFLTQDAFDCAAGRCDALNIGLDLVGAVPGVPNAGGGARAAGRAFSFFGGLGLFARTTNRVDDATDLARGFRSFTARNFRHNLELLTDLKPGKGYQAHHVFPQKFRNYFAGKIDIHNPIYGSWFNSRRHAVTAYEYNEAWRVFLNVPGGRSADEILGFGRDIARRYGFGIYF